MTITANMILKADEQFYPTPPSVARKMLENIDFRYIQNVLEPSAGKGNLIDALLTAHYDSDKWGRSLDIDLCEIDPYLRQILKYNFGGGREKELYQQMEKMRNSPDKVPQEHKALEREAAILRHGEVRIVHDDFLTYRSFKPYQLILMNPPFANGDLHLLHALDLQKNGGVVICLLNAETIRNPYTRTRDLLCRRLRELNADISYIDDAFSDDAERKARVDVAIVRVHIEPNIDGSDIWERMKKATAEEEMPDAELRALISGDYLEQAILLYKTEIAATMELVREYKALSPYIMKKLNAEEHYEQEPIITLTVTGDNYIHGFDINKYMHKVRLKYWRALFENKKFTGRLTSELQQKYYENVERMADYEFSAFNIKQVMDEMNLSITSGIEKAVLDLFDKLTVEHSWYPECANNRHYFNGWSTNKAHKIGKKCIIPTSGMFSSYSWHKEAFQVSTAYAVISDIEKAFDYLDGARTTDEIGLLLRLNVACRTATTRNIECKYFKIDLFKKGTTHIKFLPSAMPLVEKLNIYASRKKGWLPPNYGKASYHEMKAEEKAVIDSFHGDGTAGSGADAYREVITKAEYFLAEPTQHMPALMQGEHIDE